MSQEWGWTIIPDGSGWRRAIASPRPVAILECEAIASLVSQGFTVFCVGGGGIPVARAVDGGLEGVEAVIDKDHASGLLARDLGADCLLLLTDVDAVYRDWRTASQQAIAEIDPDYLDPLAFEPGTMRPKVEAATIFVQDTGKCAVIGKSEDISELLAGKAGTQFRRSKNVPAPE